MTTYFTYSGRNEKKNLQLDGNLLTGDTYDVKNFIRQHCGGTWDKAAQGWRINVDKLMALTEIRNQIGLDIDNSPRPQAAQQQSTMSRAQYYDLITEGHGKDW
jgi:hypothetical protein